MELSTRYTPKDIEEPLYTKWNDSGCFQPPAEGEGSGKPFTVMIPPPNVTGVLHMGHALNGTVQDIVVRHRRKSGFDTLWVPGTDHAGIATQAVVEKRIYAEEGKTRDDLGREEFLRRIWDWKEESGGQITRQLRRLGRHRAVSRLLGLLFRLGGHLSHLLLLGDNLIGHRCRRLLRSWSLGAVRIMMQLRLLLVPPFVRRLQVGLIAFDSSGDGDGSDDDMVGS